MNKQFRAYYKPKELKLKKSNKRSKSESVKNWLWSSNRAICHFTKISIMSLIFFVLSLQLATHSRHRKFAIKNWNLWRDEKNFSWPRYETKKNYYIIIFNVRGAKELAHMQNTCSRQASLSCWLINCECKKILSCERSKMRDGH